MVVTSGAGTGNLWGENWSWHATARIHGVVLMKRSTLLLLSCVLSLGTAVAQSQTPPLLAQNQDRQPPRNNLFNDSQQGERELRVSRREASDIARERFSGRVLSIRLDGRRWRVRMDQSGTVFNVFVNGETGEASRASEGED